MSDTATLLGRDQQFNPDQGRFPFRDMIGYEMDHWDGQSSRFTLDLETRHMNGDGVPHGGLYAVLLDTALGFSGAMDPDTQTRKPAVTLSLQVSFLAPPRGGKLIVEAQKTGGGRRVFFADGQVLDAEGTVVATGTGVFRFRNGPTPDVSDTL
jgi:uncharacterized protein (TIGR00369 family)